MKSNNSIFILSDVIQGKEIPCHIIYSTRKTMAIQITREGTVTVRCPLRTSKNVIRNFIADHREWISKHLEKVQVQLQKIPVLTRDETMRYRENARSILTSKVDSWARKMGVSYGRITIREQSTRWGSCSSKGNLNFNWTLVFVPEALMDYVVVHELAHRIEMNHSPAFWQIVEQQIPDYRERKTALKNYANRVNVIGES